MRFDQWKSSIALTCPGCNSRVSDKAVACVQCGRPIAGAPQPATLPLPAAMASRVPSIRPLAVLGLILAISSIGLTFQTASSSSGDQKTSQSEEPHVSRARSASAAASSKASPSPRVYLDAGRLRLLGRDAALIAVKTSLVWNAIDRKPVDRQTGEELVDLRAADGTEGLLILEKGRVTQISLTFRRSLPASIELLAFFNLKAAEGKRQDFPAGSRWRNPKGAIKLIDVMSMHGSTVVTVDFVSATRFAG
jgi:hypothetical protein